VDVHVLIDYYNLPRKVINAGATSLVTQMGALARSTYADAGEIFIRLYGGWYEDTGLSKDGTLLIQEISNNFPRPIRGPNGAICHTHCEVASSLLAMRGDLFFSTVRERRGMARLLRAGAPTACIDIPNCTAPNVIEWSRKGCPAAGCPVSHTDAFVCRQQKLVDILLCCDLITLARVGPDARIFLISEDDDFIPALLLANSFGSEVWHVRTQTVKPRFYDAMLLRSGVKITFI
jgi:hypothetical protein